MMDIPQYLDEAHQDRRLRRTTHHYISDMIEHFGPERVFEGVYGMEKPLADIVAYFRGHSMSMERRLLLLVGPQGSGKSMTVDRLKRKLEDYSHTADGALYAETVRKLFRLDEENASSAPPATGEERVPLGEAPAAGRPRSGSG